MKGLIIIVGATHEERKKITHALKFTEVNVKRLLFMTPKVACAFILGKNKDQ